MKKYFSLLIIVCIFLSGCNASENSKGGETANYEVLEYTLPYFSIICPPVIIDKDIYYLDEKAEYSYFIEKLNLFTGEVVEREIDLAEKYSIFNYTVDKEGNVYYLITIEEGEQIWNWYFVKQTKDGEQIYKKPYTYRTLEDLGLLFQIMIHESEVFINGRQKRIRIDDKGDILSIEQSVEQEKRELEAFQGAVYRRNENGPSDKMFDLIDYGIECDSLSNVVQYDDGTIVGWDISNVYIGYKVYVFIPSENPVQPQRTADVELTLAVLESDSLVKAAVYDFNKSQDDIYIVMKEYGAGGKSVDDAYAELYASIVAGNGPDIIALKSGENHRTLVESGALENLQEYVDHSKLIREEDYIKSAWEIGKCGDVLFGIPTEFSVQTMAAKSSIVGEQCGIDVEGVRKLYEKYPEMALRSEESKLSVLDMCIGYQVSNFIDYEKKTADFDKEEFYELLAFVNTFPKESKSDNRDILFYDCWVYSVNSLIQVYKEMGTKQVTFIGYPTADGSFGRLMNQGNYMYGICSRSNYKEECWRFIEHYISNRYEQGLPMQFSTRKDILEKQFEQEFEEHKSEFEGFRLEEVLADFEAICEQPGNTQRWDVIPAEIILEEVQPFFSGDRDAKKTAEIIQNRIQTYLNE